MGLVWFVILFWLVGLGKPPEPELELRANHGVVSLRLTAMDAGVSTASPDLRKGANFTPVDKGCA